MKYRTDLILGEAFCTVVFFRFPDSGLSLSNGLYFYFLGRDSENRENDKIQKTNCAMLNLKYCLRGFIKFVLLTIGSISAIDSKVVTTFSLRSIFDSCVLRSR